MAVLLVNANSLRIPLTDKSVHMIACSPPYWALRDYGTGQWVGGDPECDHKGQPMRTKAGFNERYFGKTFETDKQGEGREFYREVCGKCGAVREDAQIGLEPLHDCLAWARGEEPCGGCFVCSLRGVGREAWRVLRDDGTWWLNLGDSYCGYKGENYLTNKESSKLQSGTAVPAAQSAGTPQASGLKAKDLAGIPWRVALALQADGWWLRNDIIWHKPNPLPESVTDRCTKAHEYIFLLTKSPRYYMDMEAVKESSANVGGGPFSDRYAAAQPAHGGKSQYRSRTDSFKRDNSKRSQPIIGQGYGTHRPDREESEWDIATRNRRTIWTVSTRSYPGAHFATWPEALVEPMIKAGTSEYGVCPTCGAPWQRVVDKGEAMQRWDNPNPVRPYEASSQVTGGAQGENGSTLHMIRPSSTAGWKPGCNCDEAEPVPAVVLDLFAGSGTTGVVSRRLGRHFIGLDLSLEYLRNEARRRLSLDALDSWEKGTGITAATSQKRKAADGQLSLLLEE